MTSRRSPRCATPPSARGSARSRSSRSSTRGGSSGRSCCTARSRGAWPDRDIRLTQAIATHIAAAAERHRAVAALEESRRRLAAVLGEVADGITVQSPDGRLVYANEAAARMLGYDSPEALLAVSPAELVGGFELFDEDRRPLPLEELPGRLALTGVVMPERLVFYRVRATGEERWSLVRARPIVAADGSVEAAVIVFHDVTDRRRQEETSSSSPARACCSLRRSTSRRRSQRRPARRAEDRGLVHRLHARGRRHDPPARIEHAGGDAQAVGDVLDRYPLDVEAEVGVPLVVRTGQTLLLADVSAEGLMADVVDPEGLAAELKQIELASYLCVPLIARGRTLGAISLLSSESGRRFGPDEKELAEQLAGRAALAVDNGRLYREAEQAAARERRRSEQLLRLSQAALLVNSATDLDELLAVLTARAREIVGAARAVTTIGDAAEGEATVKAVDGLGTPPQDAAVLAAPLLGRDGRTLGAIELVGSADHPFSAEDEAILVQLAQMASVAVENFRAEAERERLVVELRSQGALLEAVLRQLPSGVIIAAPDGGVVMSNDQAAEIFQERLEVASFAGADAPAAFHEGGRALRVAGMAARPGRRAWRVRRRRGDRDQTRRRLAADHRGERGPRACGRRRDRGRDDVQRRHRPRRADERLRFLAEASTVLGSSLDYEQTLVAVSELAVPMLADWCSISVLEDDGTIKVVRGRTPIPRSGGGPTRCGGGGRCGSTTRPRPRR